MYEISMEELKQLLKNGRIAKQYALDHKEELLSRKHSFVLYGPYVPGIGASIPCNTVTPKRARKLVTKTRRKDHIIYYLDDDYHVLRTSLVLENNTRHIYHHFELNGVIYVYTYESPVLNDEVQFLRYADGKTISYGEIHRAFVFAQFYEYIDEKRMLVTSYRYTPGLKQTIYGCLPKPEAPMGAPDSFVQREIYEETIENTDFSRWFK